MSLQQENFHCFLKPVVKAFLSVVLASILANCGQRVETSSQSAGKIQENEPPSISDNKNQKPLEHGGVHEIDVDKMRESGSFNLIAPDYKNRCSKAGISLPDKIPDFRACIQSGSNCNDWTPVGPDLPAGNFAVSNDLSAQLLRWTTRDNPDTVCYYLHRHPGDWNAGVLTLNGVHCYHVKTCQVCALDIITTSGPPSGIGQLVDPSMFTAKNADCSACHASGPLAIKAKFWDAAADELGDLNALCANNGGPRWVYPVSFQPKFDFKFGSPSIPSGRKVATPSGCNNCHGGGFVKTDGNFCSLAQMACSDGKDPTGKYNDVGAMWRLIHDGKSGDKKYSFQPEIQAGTCKTSAKVAREFANKMGCESETFLGCSFSNKLKLTVTKAGRAAASGSVTSSVAGISCGADCSEDYDQCTKVTLTASPAASFRGWTGACSGTSTSCAVTMDEAKNVTATFNDVELTVTKAGTGASDGTVTSDLGAINCGVGAACKDGYNLGQVVKLKASVLPYSTFTGWGGACTGTLTTCNVTMNGAKNVTANFNKKPELSVTKVGTGDGKVTSNLGAINCGVGAACKDSYDLRQVVQLRAAAASGSTFAGWSGACAGVSVSSPCNVTMDAAKSVTAIFNRIGDVLCTTGMITVPGTANPYLAGMSSGTKIDYIVGSSKFTDSAPAQSPVTVQPTNSRCLTAGSVISFNVAGEISHGGSRTNADGGTVTSHRNGATFGKSQITAPINSLVGVFLGSSVPTSAPAALTFNTAGLRDYASSSPQLGQIFFIGDGRGPGGISQEVVVPANTRGLYLGVMDGYQWHNNSGQLSVTFTLRKK